MREGILLQIPSVNAVKKIFVWYQLYYRIPPERNLSGKENEESLHKQGFIVVLGMIKQV